MVIQGVMCTTFLTLRNGSTICICCHQNSVCYYVTEKNTSQIPFSCMTRPLNTYHHACCIFPTSGHPASQCFSLSMVQKITVIVTTTLPILIDANNGSSAASGFKRGRIFCSTLTKCCILYTISPVGFNTELFILHGMLSDTLSGRSVRLQLGWFRRTHQPTNPPTNQRAKPTLDRLHRRTKNNLLRTLE